MKRSGLPQRVQGIRPRSAKPHRVAMRTWEAKGHAVVVVRRICEATIPREINYGSVTLQPCPERPTEDHHYMHRRGRIPEVWAHHPAFRLHLCKQHHDMDHGIRAGEVSLHDRLGHIVIRRLRATWPEVEFITDSLGGMQATDAIRQMVAWLIEQGHDPRDRPGVLG